MILTFHKKQENDFSVKKRKSGFYQLQDLFRFPFLFMVSFIDSFFFSLLPSDFNVILFLVSQSFPSFHHFSFSFLVSFHHFSFMFIIPFIIPCLSFIALLLFLVSPFSFINPFSHSSFILIGSFIVSR